MIRPVPAVVALSWLLISCSSYYHNSPEAVQERAQQSALLKQQQQRDNWEKYLDLQDAAKLGRLRDLYVESSYTSSNLAKLASKRWRWDQLATEYGASLDETGYLEFKQKLLADHSSALAELERGLRDIFGDDYTTYVTDYRQKDALGALLMDLDDRLGRLDERYSQALLLGRAYRSSLERLSVANLKVTSKESVVLRVVDAGLDIGNSAMIVLEIRNDHPANIVYVQMADYGSYQDDSGVERAYKYVKGIAVTDEFGNRYKISKVDRGHAIGGSFKYSLGMRADLPLRPGEQIRVRIAIEPQPPEAAASLIIKFLTRSIGNDDEFRIVMPAEHLLVKRTELKEDTRPVFQ